MKFGIFHTSIFEKNIFNFIFFLFIPNFEVKIFGKICDSEEMKTVLKSPGWAIECPVKWNFIKSVVENRIKTQHPNGHIDG